jgi:chlorophyll(ide) b reductase
VNIVITGSTKGIGLALAIEFLNYDDNLAISSRTEEKVNSVVEELQEQFPENKIIGIVCDVTKGSDLANLATKAKENLGTIDIWINNAGTNGPERGDLVNISDEAFREVVETNLMGVLMGSREALKMMIEQGKGHLFNMAGWGSDGRPSPSVAVYGATKASIPQLTKTLVKETKGMGVGVHNLSPGMVLTDLLLTHADKEAWKIFNILAEKPETVVKKLVPKIRAIKGTGKSIKYLTRKSVMWRFITARRRKNRFFDEEKTQENSG